MSKKMNRKNIFIIAAIISLAFFWEGGEVAEGGFWDKARDLMKGIQKATPESSPLGLDEIGRGLKEALRVGSGRVVSQLGQKDGFNSDREIHIPLPDKLKKVQSTLRKIGMSSMADDLELRLNRAAEAATPKAKAIFWKTISDMTLEDVKGIYEGPSDAATQYFKAKMTHPLKENMRPIVDDVLSKVGAIQSYDNMMGRYLSLPFVPDIKSDLSSHVLEKALGGIFLYLGREEAAIRQNPVKRTTEILQKVFGSGL